MGFTTVKPTTPLEDAAAVFVGLRVRLFGIAYRMLGSAAEVEDVAQDAWLRWQVNRLAAANHALIGVVVDWSHASTFDPAGCQVQGSRNGIIDKGGKP